jgi:sugar/nucleoside kinase (ribokinase family)
METAWRPLKSSDMAKFDAVFVGFVTLDISGRPVSAIPEGGGIAFLEEIRLNPAGTAGGAVINAAKMGIKTAAVFCVGDDEKGDFIVNRFERLRIDCSMAQRSSRIQTSTTILPIRPNGDRPCLHCRGASDHLFVSDDLFGAVCDTKFLHHGGTGFIKAMEGGQSLKLLRYAKEKGVTVTFDLIGPHDATLAELKTLLPYVDYFMPSLEEAVYISKLPDPQDAASFFMDLGAGACIFKQGPSGSFVKTSDAQFTVPAFEIQVNDTTGCGDAYCGGFIAGLVMGHDLEAACKLGTATSGLVATGLGSDAGVVDIEATLAFMRSAKSAKAN